jgi:hypothetical protein
MPPSAAVSPSPNLDRALLRRRLRDSIGSEKSAVQADLREVSIILTLNLSIESAIARLGPFHPYAPRTLSSTSSLPGRAQYTAYAPNILGVWTRKDGVLGRTSCRHCARHIGCSVAISHWALLPRLPQASATSASKATRKSRWTRNEVCMKGNP